MHGLVLTMGEHEELSDWRRFLDTETFSDPGLRAEAALPRALALTILCHSDPRRVGERALLEISDARPSVRLSRLEPEFSPLRGGRRRPLADPRLSRDPILLTADREGLIFEVAEAGNPLEVQGQPARGRGRISAAELERGVVLLVGEQLALCLHWCEASVVSPPPYGLVGESSAMVRLRRQMAQVADLDVPVLLRGESGTGKELVARALWQAGGRRQRPYSSLNLGAIPPGLAASELFGAVKGAFSGADRQRPGYFREVDGGTLFLDEVGEAPGQVQAMLLRVLDRGEIQPVGSSRTVQVDVRVIAATDADLETAVEEERFKSPLLHRLEAFVLHLPPLRERREDFGRLFFHFLEEALESLGEEDRLQPRRPVEHPFVPARLVAQLALGQWPGNVRELRNVTRRAAILSRGGDRLRLEDGGAGEGEHLAAGASSSNGRKATLRAPSWSTEAPDSPQPGNPYRDPSTIGEEELRSTLRAHEWNLLRTTRALGISRGSLYALIERFPSVRTAADLTREELERGLEEHGLDLEELARRLEVSKQGLKRRLSHLNLLQST